MRINQNVLAIRTNGQLSLTTNRLDKSIEKLGSGLRINRAADDAAGLAISEKMRRSIRGLSRAALNAQDGISLIQTGEGALGEMQAIIQRMRELAIQSSNDTLTSNDRLEIQKEVVQLRSDLDRISHNTEFNTKRLLDGSQSALVSATSKYAKGIVTGDVVGGDYEISLTLVKGGVASMIRTQTMTNFYDGALAQGATQIMSIAQFYDANGTFAFESPQTIFISGNGKSTSITVDRSTTLGDLAGLISAAVQNPSGLGMTASQVDAVTTASTSIAGKGGYLEITSGIIGERGIINFSGENALINGLGLQSVRDPINNVIQATAVDASGNQNVISTNDNRIKGILDGVDVKFTSQAAQLAGSGGVVEGIRPYTADASFTISANGQNVTITLSGGTDISGLWTMEGIARSINRDIITAISGAGQNMLAGMKAVVVDGEIRIEYDPVTAPNSFTIVGFAASGLALGFTDGTKAGMTTGVRDRNKSVWGFSKYMTAAETVVFSVKDAVNSVTITMFSAATALSTSDMIGLDFLRISVNEQLSTAGLAIIVDQTGNTFAFTATNIGRTIAVNGTVSESRVTINVTATTAFGDQFVLNNLGFQDKSADGFGERNFRMHIVNNNPQFQIGSDQGQIMKVGIGSMDADALDLMNLDFTSIQGASKAMGKLSKALDLVSAERSKMGAYQNRLEYAINNLNSMHTNIMAAESRIRDADIASEMVEFTRNQIVNQSGTAMLAQANLVPQGILQLLR